MPSILGIKQISLLEQFSLDLEDKLKTEIIRITALFEENINTVNKNYNEEIMFYKNKVNIMEEQHVKDIELLKNNHSRVLEEIKSEHALHIEYLKQFHKREMEISADGQLYSKKLDNGIEILNSTATVLQEVNEKINKESDVISIARQSSIESREKEIIHSMPHAISGTLYTRFYGRPMVICAIGVKISTPFPPRLNVHRELNLTDKRQFVDGLLRPGTEIGDMCHVYGLLYFATLLYLCYILY
ncbi:hypothetical protein NQ315_013370 [Exocentrus adspersus]|uniref:Uncharacterized protein n=1 Tax=Exocentrus adspersus TaxID=1586481 RepID=A0AAV8VT61_9CUCU|nr:hypothetical protein NQ315_013370 [Exocentrus adspersus]